MQPVSFMIFAEILSSSEVHHGKRVRVHVLDVFASLPIGSQLRVNAASHWTRLRHSDCKDILLIASLWVCAPPVVPRTAINVAALFVRRRNESVHERH